MEAVLFLTVPLKVPPNHSCCSGSLSLVTAAVPILPSELLVSSLAIQFLRLGLIAEELKVIRA